MPRGPQLSPMTRQAVIADYVMKIQPEVIAAKHSIHVRSVYRIVRALKDAPIKPEISKSDSDIKTQVISECWTGFRAGINCEDDPYKRGTLSAIGLKGLGVFQPDNVTQINNLYASLPEDWKQDYEITGRTSEPSLLGPGEGSTTLDH